MMSESEMNGNSKKSSFSPLEMDLNHKDEYDSLVHETGDFPQCGHVVSRLTLRRKKRRTLPNLMNRGNVVLGLLHHTTNTGFALRYALMLGMLGGAALLFLRTMDTTVESMDMGGKPENKLGTHQSHFGGEQNVAQPGGAVSFDNKQDDAIVLPQAHSTRAVPSLSEENVINHVGHYWQDPHNGPYASHLYTRNANDIVLEMEEADFNETMEQTKTKWGAWNLTDTYYQENGHERPKVMWESYDYRDAPIEKFPSDAWQNDEDYVGRLLNESKALVHRVKEAIYEEYGHATVSNNNASLSQEQQAKRDELFRVVVDTNFAIRDGVAVDHDNVPLKGIAYLHPNAWHGLVTKLLHTMLTGDYFYVVLGGDDAASGKGNNFVQSQMMQFHYLMEPVFDFMDMHLVSRNMAMSSGTTSTSALGGADVYGEADVMLWSVQHLEDNKTPVQIHGEADLFNKQAIMSGERVPLLLTPQQVNVMRASKGQAWVGNLQAGAAMCEETQDIKATGVTPACRYLNCPPKHSDLCKPQYNSVCWVDRTDYVPETEQKQHVDETNKGYPGPLAHQLEGRKLALLLLHALDAAIDKWQHGIEQDGFPLKESYWHVGQQYKEIQENVGAARTDDNDDHFPGCEQLFAEFPIVCGVAMHAFTEWTPRVTPNTTSLRAIVRSDVPIYTQTPVMPYEKMDLLPLEWKIPSDAIDVHAVALATNAPPPESNEFGMYDDVYYFDDYDDDVDYYDDDVVRHLSVPTESVGISENVHAESQSSAGSTIYSWIRKAVGEKDTIVPGLGWMVYNEVAGFCDGSAQSTCKRSTDSDCLMAGHNDGQAGLLGDALSGWLILSLPKVKHGVILARFQTDIAASANEATDGWTMVNQGNNEAEDNDRRRMFIPREFEFDFAINGKITTLSGHDFINKGVNIGNDLTVWPLLLDEEMSKRHGSDDEGETVEVAIRIRSESGRQATILLSHLYYA